jgi:hypothetical protein
VKLTLVAAGSVAGADVGCPSAHRERRRRPPEPRVAALRGTMATKFTLYMPMGVGVPSAARTMVPRSPAGSLKKRGT